MGMGPRSVQSKCPLPRRYSPIPVTVSENLLSKHPEQLNNVITARALWRSLACVCHDRSCIRSLTGISSARRSEHLCAANSLICPLQEIQGSGTTMGSTTAPGGLP